MGHKDKKRPSANRRKNDRWKIGKPGGMTKSVFARTKRKKKADKLQIKLKKKGKEGHTYKSNILDRTTINS